jgi:hypothetical protein
MSKFWLALLVLVVIAGGIWFYARVVKAPASSNGGNTTSTSVSYSNTAYGFGVKLPGDWDSYSVKNLEWNGQIENTNGTPSTKTDSGAQIEISAPPAAADGQPIPVMIFTHHQWDLVSAAYGHDLTGESSTSTEFMNIGAAPIGPFKLGENSKYVFAIPARYNYAFPPGYEKTDTIIKDKSAWSFFEPAGITFTSPKKSDTWNVGETHRVSWLGGGNKITLFLIDKKLADTAGASVSISERFYNAPNNGYYDYTVRQGLSGTYSWSITDLVQSATSSYFNIK